MSKNVPFYYINDKTSSSRPRPTWKEFFESGKLYKLRKDCSFYQIPISPEQRRRESAGFAGADWQIEKGGSIILCLGFAKYKATSHELFTDDWDIEFLASNSKKVCMLAAIENFDESIPSLYLDFLIKLEL